MKNQPPGDACCTVDEALPADRRNQPLEGDAADAEFGALAKAVGHPVRVRILRMLARKEARAYSVIVGVIVDELPLAQSTVSEHLRIVRSAGLVRANENGLRVSYCIVPGALKRFKALLDALAVQE